MFTPPFTIFPPLFTIFPPLFIVFVLFSISKCYLFQHIFASVHCVSSLYSQSFPLYIQYFSLRQQYYPSVYGISAFIPIISTPVHNFLASIYISCPPIHRYSPSSPPFRFLIVTAVYATMTTRYLLLVLSLHKLIFVHIKLLPFF